MIKNQYSLNECTELFIKYYTSELIQDLHPDVYHWITHKIRHSYAVLNVAQKIMGVDSFLKGLSPVIKKKMEIASLLHDIARFSQHNTQRVLKETEFEHGNEGFKILEKEGFTDKAILLGVKYHNKFLSNSYKDDLLFIDSSEEERNEIELVVKLVRDADKLQNIEYNIFDNGKLFSKFADIGSPESRKGTPGFIKESILEQFNNNELISSALVDTAAEKILNIVSWKYDINFKGTFDILEYSRFNEFIMSSLKELKTSEENLALISNRLIAFNR